MSNKELIDIQTTFNNELQKLIDYIDKYYNFDSGIFKYKSLVKELIKVKPTEPIMNFIMYIYKK